MHKDRSKPWLMLPTVNCLPDLAVLPDLTLGLDGGAREAVSPPAEPQTESRAGGERAVRFAMRSAGGRGSAGCFSESRRDRLCLERGHERGVADG